MSFDPHATWRNPRILFTLLLVFLCGSLAGALVMRYLNEPPAPSAAVYWNKGGKENTMQRFDRELNLTPKQSAAIEAILDDFMMYYHSLNSQMDEVRANGKQRIMNVLEPEQQRQFEEVLREIPLREVH
jgi:Spy/CpxP family protein refolding chaperone